MKLAVPSVLAGALFALIAAPAPASAQIGGMLRGAVNDAAQTKINNMVNCAVNDQDCIDKAHADGKKVTVVDAKGKPLKDQSAANKTSTDQSGNGAATAGDASASSDPPGKGAWLNYDFIPGDTVLFFDDFSTDKVGDLPTHEDISGGNVTVVDIKGTKYLHTTTGGDMTVSLPEVLPQRFTIEFTFHRSGGNGSGLDLRLGDDGELTFRCDQGTGRIMGRGPNGPKEAGQDVPVGENDLEVCRLMVDGGYAKGYVNSTRIGQLNGLVFPREDKIHISLPNADDNGALLTGLRVAAGGRDLYDGLNASGRIVTQGILFDVSSDRIRGESTPTLKAIGDMLTQHADLKLTIEGHTDNTGTASTNQTLSEKRAAAVRQYLIDNYKIDGSRLKSAGFGSAKPIASNDTPEGRQNNRRVELVKN
jgi:outer membrane protein OmpA-like peptidoglycan-associated protein